MEKMSLLAKSLVLAILFSPISGQWGFSPEESEVYDLVDEAGINFYDFLGVAQDAATSEIRRSYRKLSLTMHPDKNKTEGAEEGFRILVAVYEVLKSKEKREIYDDVLVNGLPPAYRYVPRQIRKMGMLEVSIIISLIFTIGHFLIQWGRYIDRKLVDEERSVRRKQRRNRAAQDEEADAAEDQINNLKPGLRDLLPILLVRSLFCFVVAIPGAVRSHLDHRKKQQMKKQMMEEEQQREDELARQQKEKRNEAKRLKQERTKKKREEMILAKKLAAESAPSSQPSTFEASVVDQELDNINALYDEIENTKRSKKKKSKKNTWDEQDHSELAKLMSKHPRGSTERWQKIAREMGRSVQEVTSRATQAKDYVGSKAKYSAVTLPSQTKPAVDISDSIITQRFDAETEATDSDKNPGTVEKGDGSKESVDDQSLWKQSQQDCLQAALAQFPKTTVERWDKIATLVPGKTKEECIARYKFIAENLRLKKQQKS